MQNSAISRTPSFTIVPSPKKRLWFGLSGALFLCTLATPARADQFVLFDATFDYTWDDAVNSTPSKSHYYITDGNQLNQERPSNWVTPVNYRDGSVHIRVEVLSKPAGDQDVGWALCYIANEGAYGCPYTDYYSAVGTYDSDVSMDDFWKSGPITWEAGIKQVDLVYTINSSGSGHVHNYPDLKDETTPTSVRISMVQVSEGDTFDPSILEEPATGSGGADAGVGGSSSLPGSGGSEFQTTGGSASTGDGDGDDGGGSDDATTDSDDTSGEGSGDSTSGCSSANQSGGRSSPWLFLCVFGLSALARLRQRRSA